MLREITSQALRQAGLGPDQVAGAGLGIAGYDWPSQYADGLAAAQLLGLGGPLEVVNDAIVGLLAGAPAGWGVAVVAGTGCNCRAPNCRLTRAKSVVYWSKVWERSQCTQRSGSTRPRKALSH